MNAMTVCASHSPLMMTGIEESSAGAHRSFFDAIRAAADRVKAFDPELVVLFSPDHFNALYYDLMPSFCVVGGATASGDWHLPTGELRIPRDIAIDLARALQRDGFDPALSLKLRVDHGMTVALRQIAGGYTAYPVLPIYINCAADPRPSCRRSREFGATVGRFVATLGRRVLVIGSGGLSHDPPTPRIAQCTPEQAARITVRHEATPEVFEQRERRVVELARALAAGAGPLLPPDEAWDRRVVDALLAGDLESFDRYTDDDIDRTGGFGGHEIRCWIAAFAAMQALDPRSAAVARLDYYRIIPEWITGMAITSTRFEAQNR